MLGLEYKVVRRFITIVAFLIAITIVTGYTRQSHAQTITEVKPGVPVSLRIHDTDLQISGCVAPNSLVTLIRDTTVVGTVSSDAQGNYERLLTSQTASIHLINTYFEDADNVRSSTTSNLVALAPKALTTLTVNAPPTVTHTPESVELGQTVVFSGYGCPNTTVSILIDNNLTVTTKTDSNGLWKIELNSVNFSQGAHTYTISASAPGYISSTSQKYHFSVVAAPETQNFPNNQAPVIEQKRELTAPIITSPKDGFLSSSRQVDITGTGSTNTQIEIYSDGVLIGSVFSNSFGDWILTVTLQKDSQMFTARSCDDSDCSADSNQVQITFNGDLVACSINVRLGKYRFNRLSVSEGIDLDITVDNHETQYEATIDWGDITIDHQSQNDGYLKTHHAYSEIGNYNGRVTALNEEGCADTVYFSVEVVDKSSFSIVWLFLPTALLVSYFSIRYYRASRENDTIVLKDK